MAAARPLVLGEQPHDLDDLHADEPSLLLLQFIARELGDSRVLIPTRSYTKPRDATNL